MDIFCILVQGFEMECVDVDISILPTFIKNIALKIKLAQRDQVEDENLKIQPEEKDGTKIQKINSCEKCCLNFPSKDKLKKHKSEMHKVILTF